MRYATIVEKTPSNYSAYVPDLPGCIATGTSIEEVLSQIQSAISFHLEGLPIPEPTTVCEYLITPIYLIDRYSAKGLKSVYFWYRSRIWRYSR